MKSKITNFKINDLDNLLKFLSKPIKEIELLYEKKRKARSLMIKEYFSEFDKK